MIKYLYYLCTALEYVTFIFLLIVYPLIPIIYSSEGYFQERGYQNTVIENERLNKFIYLWLPFFILGILNIFRVGQIPGIPPGGIEPILLPQVFHQGTNSLPLFRLVILFVTLVFGSALLKKTFLTLKKKFSFYFAKGCMKLVSKKEDEYEVLN